MALIAGIDEAGLGPVLGPLVVSAAAFEIEDDDVGRGLRRQLSGVVTRKRVATRRSVVINDSKVVYSPASGLTTLETSILACLGPPWRSSLADFCERVREDNASLEMASYPWYAAVHANGDVVIPVAAQPEDVAFLHAALGRRMTASGVRLAMLESRVLLVGQLNRLLDAGLNKSEAVFSVVAHLLRRLRTIATDQKLIVRLDRQGGRVFYFDLLRQVFDGAWIWILEESPRCSSYRIDDDGREIIIEVRVGADSRYLPVALASMLSKYLRELLMGFINQYWIRQVPDLRPTAGYPQDGKRFLGEIAASAERLNIEQDIIRRKK